MFDFTFFNGKNELVNDMELMLITRINRPRILMTEDEYESLLVRERTRLMRSLTIDNNILQQVIYENENGFLLKTEFLKQ